MDFMKYLVLLVIALATMRTCTEVQDVHQLLKDRVILISRETVKQL